MNRDRVYLFLLITGILLVSFVNNLYFLSVYFSLVLLLFFLKGLDFLSFVSQFLKILPFSLVLSLAYLLHAMINRLNPYFYIVLFNLRLFSIVFSLMLFRKIANPLKALSFSRSLVHIFMLTYSQTESYMRTYRNFELVMESRVVKDGGFRERLRFFARMLEFFFLKSVEYSKNVSMALKARGFFIE